MKRPIQVAHTDFEARSLVAKQSLYLREQIRKLESQELQNRYDAARWSEDRTWRRAELQSARLDVTRATREQLQSKAQDFDQNSPIFNKLADSWEQNTVGAGLPFIPASSDPEFNKWALEAWETWKQFADISSRLNFDAKQGIIARSSFVMGGDFVILTRDPANNRARIQCIEAHFCKTPPQLADREGKTIFDGVEVDSFGRPQRYWFQTDTNRYEPFEAWQVVHIFEPSRHNQLREIPYIACSTNTLTDMLDLAELEMKHCKVSAENSLNVFTENGQMPPSMGYKEPRFTGQPVQNSDGSTGQQQRVDYYRNAYGGRVNVAMRGDKIEEHLSQRPSEAWRAQQRSLAENVCAGVGIPLLAIFPDSMQGTVARAVLDQANAFFRTKSAMYAMHFARIYEYVINSEASFNPRLQKRPADWKRLSWRPPRAINVDVGRNSNALVQELAAGLRTYTGAGAELGFDGKQLLREKADEAAYVRQLATERGLEVSEISNLQVPEVVEAPVEEEIPAK